MNGTSKIVDLDQPRRTREIVAAAGRLYSAFPLLFLVLALAVIGPFDLALLAATGHPPLRDGGESATAVLLEELIRLALISPLISALHLHAVELAGRGERPTVRAVAAQGLRVLPVVAAASIVAGIGITVGFVFLILPGLYLSLRWAVVAQAAAAESGDWTRALSRSTALTRERFVHVFGALLVAGLFGEAVRLAAKAVHIASASAGAVALGVAADTLTASFAALILALLYFDLVARPRTTQAARREHPHLRDLD